MFWSPAISLQHRTISYFFSCQTRVERERLSSAWKPIWEKTGRGLSFSGAYKMRSSLWLCPHAFRGHVLLLRVLLLSSTEHQAVAPARGKALQCDKVKCSSGQVCHGFIVSCIQRTILSCETKNRLKPHGWQQCMILWFFHSLTLDFLSCDFRQEGHFALSPSFTVLRPESRLKVTVRTHFHKCSFDARQKICKPADCAIK